MYIKLDFLFVFIFIVTSYGWPRIYSAEYTYLINTGGSSQFHDHKMKLSSTLRKIFSKATRKVRMAIERLQVEDGN